MKQLTLFILVAIAVCSCSTLKKVTNRMKSSSDSTGTKTTALVDVKKKDTSGVSAVSTSERKSSDSTYEKTTVVKEYYTDEFNFGDADTDTSFRQPQQTPGKINSKHPAKRPSKKVLYRETTTTEKGNVQKTEDNSQVSKQKTNASSVDSSAKEETSKAEVSSSETNVSKDVKRYRVLAGWGLVVVVVILLYLYYKNPRLLT